MTTTLNSKLTLVMLIVVAWSLAPSAHAAEILIATTPEIPVAGEDFTLSVRLAVEGDSINAAEGVLKLSGAEVKSISTGGSAFSLWPIEPRYMPGAHSIEFAGGVPGALQSTESTLLFTVVARAPVAGLYTVSLESARAFKANGLGTPLYIEPFSKRISVAASGEPQAKKQQDTVPPQFVSVETGQDPSLFGGRTFISFFASDDQSGVASYEVKEGWWSRYKKADRYYVLNDQTLGKDIWVRVTDASGNTAVHKIDSPHQTNARWFIVGGILIVLLAAFAYRRKRKQ